ncbi:MAG: hypothetical protein HC899_35900, partial [Leptolyngbyaceae cyanobacterium SM1_4_3]|nr:hypothetical protein [Leptolyngbyaceae cyanobacterium SM1_4_3]
MERLLASAGSWSFQSVTTKPTPGNEAEIVPDCLPERSQLLPERSRPPPTVP